MLYEVPLPPNQEVDIYAFTGIPIGTKILAQNVGLTLVGVKAPEDEIYTQLGLTLFAENDINDTGALALSSSLPGLLAVQVSPWDGAYSGLRAINVQFYDESNKKLGSQWGGSKRFVNAALGQKFYTVIKTRSLPIDLKSREFSYTGNGVIGRFYTGFTPQNLGAITPETFYCLRPKMPAFRDFDVYVLPAAPASLGARWNYDLVLEGPQQVQGKGNAGQQAGAGWIIDPNEEVLLEIESLDTQNISATILLFNGLLDLPL